MYKSFGALLIEMWLFLIFLWRKLGIFINNVKYLESPQIITFGMWCGMVHFSYLLCCSLFLKEFFRDSHNTFLTKLMLISTDAAFTAFLIAELNYPPKRKFKWWRADFGSLFGTYSMVGEVEATGHNVSEVRKKRRLNTLCLALSPFKYDPRQREHGAAHHFNLYFLNHIT